MPKIPHPPGWQHMFVLKLTINPSSTSKAVLTEYRAFIKQNSWALLPRLVPPGMSDLEIVFGHYNLDEYHEEEDKIIQKMKADMKEDKSREYRLYVDFGGHTAEGMWISEWEEIQFR